jgi:hypothetical protein
LQINRVFLLRDVIDILHQRTQKPKITLHKDLPFQTLKSNIISTKQSNFVIVSMESNKLHIFLHDYKHISRCAWDGNILFNQKKEILQNMLLWWHQQHSVFHNKIIDHEDRLAYSDIVHDLRDLYD